MTLPDIPCSNGKDLSKIRVKKQNRDTNAVDCVKVLGADTETDKGDIFLIRLSNGAKLENPDISFENVAKFLLHYEGHLLFFHNLQYDADCILKLLPEQTLKQYLQTEELTFEWNGYVIRYIPKKRLTIINGRHSVSCYDIAQFYDNRDLVTVYKECTGQPLSSEYLAMKENRKHFNLRYFQRNKKRVRQYCLEDCKMTEEIALNWINTFREQFDFIVGKWISSGYLAEKVLICNGIKIPFFNELPYPVQELAWLAFYGGRFELLIKGFIGECWLYDINSAYPYALSKIPDITCGKWVSGKKIHPKAALGFYRILADVDNSVRVSPFPFRTKDNMLIYPVGKFETYVTLEELKAVEGDNRISYKILDSWQFIPDKNCTYPFKEFIEQQYNKRLELKENGDQLERAIKVVLNSMYGKMAQRVNNRIGNLFNPVIAAFITGYTRAQLYHFVRKHDLDRYVVAFATDSIAIKKEVPNLNSKKLGEMKLDKHASDVIFLSNGYYRFNGKWKRRGVGYDRETKQEVEHLDTRITEDGQLYIKVKTPKTTHIKGGIRNNKVKDVGKIEEYEKHIKLNSDKKRFWLSELESLKDGTCCNSAPWNVDMIADLIVEKSELEWENEQEEKYEPESDL
jgi:hypothetical protein